jgi:hypothetical protein
MYKLLIAGLLGLAAARKPLYIELRGLAFQGTNFVEEARTLNDCVNACYRTSVCSVASYDRLRGICYLKTDAESPAFLPAITSYLFPGKSTFDGVDFFPLPSDKNVTVPNMLISDCKKKCDESNACVGALYDVVTRHCILKTALRASRGDNSKVLIL